jgi:CHAD domain-containing protein
MAYRFKRKQAVTQNLRRIARQQIDRACTELTREAPTRAEDIHAARKRFKKLRSLLRLAKPSLAGDVYRTGNRRLRDLGHALAGRRDAEVMLETLDSLARDLREDGHDPGLDALYDVLQARLAAGEAAALDASGTSGQEAAGELARIGAGLDDWELDTDGYAALAPGLLTGYRRGRKAMRRASRQQRSATRFHDWRKRVKDHWYHCRLLRYLWPGPLRARADELKALSDLLGDDHDLAVFRQTLGAIPDHVLTSGTRERLLAAIRDRQRSLRKAAFRLGQRVYAEKPRDFDRRFSRYAQAARR